MYIYTYYVEGLMPCKLRAWYPVSLFTLNMLGAWCPGLVPHAWLRSRSRIVVVVELSIVNELLIKN